MINRDIKIIIIAGTVLTLLSSAVCLFIKPLCSVVCLLLGAILTAIFFAYTKKRYDRLNELNDYLSLVCAGNYNLDIADNTEGELSILKNNLYKVITILKSQNEALAADRIHLADSLADISHQLKTPLTSMMVMADLLRKEKSQDKRDEFISVIENQLDKIKWLVTTLLKISRLDAGTVIFKNEVHSCDDIISTAVAPFLVMLELKGIELQCEVPDFLLCVDRRWTIEALENIIKNCAEHTQSGGKISITGESTNLSSIIRISDNGCGIAPEELPHIFERFYHGRGSSDDSVGIGLALSKSIFERENAEISAKSKEGVGTEFTVKFYKAII